MIPYNNVTKQEERNKKYPLHAVGVSLIVARTELILNTDYLFTPTQYTVINRPTLFEHEEREWLS